MAELSNPIEEARRYVENAREILKSKGAPFDGRYTDSKYIRTAGHVAWSGILIALEAIMKIKDPERVKRVEFSDYLAAIPKKEKAAKADLESAYVILHLHMGYDGIKLKLMVDSGIKLAKDIIDWCSDYYTPPKKDVKINTKQSKKKAQPKALRKGA
jgi:2',3'-cyclic-nucleotide 2'-phosphodiesterase (5'-nucleotidase family)